MKFVKVLAVLTALLVLAFLVMGWITPEYSYENRVTIKAPVERVFATFMDESRMKEWMPTFSHMENIRGAKRAIGSQWRLVFEENGERIELLEEVTVYEPLERYAFKMDADPFAGDTDIRFTAIDSSTTELGAVTHVVGKGMVWKSLMALSKSTITERSQQQYEMLRDLIEAE